MNLDLDRRDFLRGAGFAALAALGRNALGEDSAPARVKMAQIGTNHPHAAGKWQTMQHLSGLIDCLGVWEPDPDARREAEKTPAFRDAHWLTEDELFGRRDLEAVLVETELPDLLKYGRRVLESGRNLGMDKPLGNNLAEFVALQEMAAAKHLIFQPGYMYRYHPAFLAAFEVMRKGLLGKVFAVNADIGKQMPRDRWRWLGDAYTGSMMALGSHMLDLAVAVLGKPDKVAAFRRRTYPDRGNFHDNEMALLQYPESLGTVRCMCNEVDGEDRRQFAIFGDKGTVELLPLEEAHGKPARARLALLHPSGGYKGGSHYLEIPPVTDRYEGLLRDFVGQVRGQPPRFPQYNAAHDRLVQEITLQFYGSANT